MENNKKVSEKIKIRTTIQFSNSTSGYFSEEYKTITLKRCMHPYVHHSIIYNNQATEVT